MNTRLSRRDAGLRSTLPLLLAASALPSPLMAAAAPQLFSEATFTEVVNDVSVVSGKDASMVKATKAAKFLAPDLVKTGRRSRAQLTAADGTVGRVGSNAVFSFDKDSRTMHLERGSVLFHTPTGKGGGTIVTNAATASVIGTTVIVTATSDGGFKMFVLEGIAKVTFPNGFISSINPGQMTFVLPGARVSDGAKGATPGPVLTFDLGALAKDSGLVGGFSAPLASAAKVEGAVGAQNAAIAGGDLARTGAFILGATAPDEIFVTSQDAVKQAVIDRTPPVPPPVDQAARLATALAASLAYNGGAFPADHVFLTPVALTLPGFNHPDFLGFAAGHLDIGTAGVDLAVFDGLPYVGVVGAGASTLVISADTTFTGLSATRELDIGGASLAIADGKTVHVAFAGTAPASVTFFSGAPLTLNGVTLDAPGASLTVATTGGDLTFAGAHLTAGGALRLTTSGQAALLTGTTADGGSISLAATGDTHLGGASALRSSGADILVTTGAALLLDGAPSAQSARDLTLFAIGSATLADGTLSAARHLAITSNATLTAGAISATAGAGTIRLAAGGALVLGNAGSAAVLLAVGNVSLFSAQSAALSAPGPLALTLTDATVQSTSGDVAINGGFGSNVTLTNTTVSSPTGPLTVTTPGTLTLGGGTTLAGGTGLTLNATGDVAATGGAVGSLGGAVAIAGASLNLAGTSVFAGASSTFGADAAGAITAANLDITSTALTMGGRFGGAAGLIDLATVNTSALTVNLSAQTLVLSGVDFAAGAKVTLRTATGLRNTSAGTVIGRLNLTGAVNLGGVDVLAGNLLWAPAANLGDPSAPIHLLDLSTADFSGTPLEFAKANDLTFAGAVTVIPNAHRVSAPVLTGADFVPAVFASLPDVNLYDLSGTPTPHPATEVFGVLARNITVTGGIIDLTPLSGALAHVDVVALGTFTWSGAMTLTGQSPNPILELRATNWVISPGASYTNTLPPNSDAFADGESVSFIGVNAMTLNSVTITHDAGSVNVRSLLGDLTLTGTQVAAGAGTVFNGGRIRLIAAGNLTLTGADLAAERGSLDLESGGVLSVAASTLKSQDSLNLTSPILEPLVVRAATRVTFTGGTLNARSITIGGNAFSSGVDLPLLDVNGTAFAVSDGAAGIRMSAMTMNLTNVDFPANSQVRLRSNDGVLNIGGANLLGAVNFVSGIKYGGVNVMTVAGINNTVWVEQGATAIRFQGLPTPGSPLEGATGTVAGQAPASVLASIHIQTLAAPDQPGAH